MYEDHFQAQDELAERIRSIGYKVDGRLSAMIDISKVIEDSKDSQKDDVEMIATLAEAQKTLAATLSGASNGSRFMGPISTVPESSCMPLR